MTASITSQNKSDVTFCFKTFLVAPGLLLMKLSAAYGVKNVSLRPPQAEAEPESALGVPTPTLVSSALILPFMTQRGIADFGREGYTGYILKKLKV